MIKIPLINQTIGTESKHEPNAKWVKELEANLPQLMAIINKEQKKKKVIPKLGKIPKEGG
jgi:PII-like signaling protein